MKNLVEIHGTLKNLSDTTCTICEIKKSIPLYNYHFEDGNSQIRRCTACGHMFIYPVPLAKLNKRTMDSISDAEFFGNTTLKTAHTKLIIGP